MDINSVIEKLKDLESRATPGEWTVSGTGNVILDWEGDKDWSYCILAKAATRHPEDNSKFIAFSRNECRRLIEALEEAQKVLWANEKLLSMLTECSGEMIHANDVRPELVNTRALLAKWEGK